MNLLVVTFNLKGGAGRALETYLSFWESQGHDYRVILGDTSVEVDHPKMAKWQDVLGKKSPLGERMEKYGRRIEDEYGDSALLHYGSERFLETEWFAWADLVEFRQIHPGGHRHFFDLSLVSEIRKRKPIVWRLSDMWSFTGYCAYALDCGQWKSFCRECPQLTPPTRHLAELRKYRKDITPQSFARKKKNLSAVDVHFVCPSVWMQRNLDDSFLAKAGSTVIRNGIDTAAFRPMKPSSFGRMPGELVLAVNIPSPTNYRKALDLLYGVLERVSRKSKVLVLRIGNKSYGEVIANYNLGDNIRFHDLGFLSSKDELARAYSSADLFILPSRMDNSAQVLCEANACGTPVAAFDVGGNSEYTEDTGVLFPAYDLDQFAAFISCVAEQPSLLPSREQCRKRVLERFTLKRQYQRFLGVYEMLLKEAK